MEISKRYERFEQLYVHDIYSKISSDFNVTRAYNWKAVKEFLNKMNVDSSGIDIGCGNGRNILFRPELRLIGIDKCEELVEVCREKKLKVIKGDALAIPFKKNSFDYAMSIAVFHHLSNCFLWTITIITLIFFLWTTLKKKETKKSIREF